MRNALSCFTLQYVFIYDLPSHKFALQESENRSAITNHNRENESSQPRLDDLRNAQQLLRIYATSFLELGTENSDPAMHCIPAQEYLKRGNSHPDLLTNQ